MEHERGAFKVNREIMPDAVKGGAQEAAFCERPVGFAHAAMQNVLPKI